MRNYTYEEILKLFDSDPITPLRLSWKTEDRGASEDVEAKKTKPENIVWEIENGRYTLDEFNENAICISEEDYQLTIKEL